MDISGMLRMHGEDWEIRRDGQLIGTCLGLRFTKEQRIGFEPETDIREGDVLTGKKSKQTHTITRTDSEVAHGEVFCVYAYYGGPVGQGGGTTVNVGNAYGSNFMVNSPGGSQSVTISVEATDDLKVIVRGLLSALDELGLSDPDKDTVKEDAEYLKKKLDGGRPEPGLIRECLSGIRKKLVDAAAAAASSHITTKAGHYLGLIGAFLSKWSGGEG